MSELRDLLVEASRQVRAAPDARDEVTRRAQRRDSRRRLGAGIVGMSLFLAVVVVVIVAVGTAENGRVVGTSGLPSEAPTASPIAARVVEDSSLVDENSSVGSAAVGFGSVWVSGFDEDGAFVLRVDGTTGEVIARIDSALTRWEVGGGGLATGLGNVWLAGTSPGSGAVLQRLDPESNAVASTTALGADDGLDIYVAESAIWVLVASADASAPRVIHELVRVDPTTQELVARVQLDLDFARRIVPTSDAIWIAGNMMSGDTIGESMLQRVHPDANIADSPLTVSGLGGVTSAGGDLYGLVPVGSQQGLVRLDPSTAQPITSPIVIGDAARAVGLESGAGGIWLLAYNANEDGSGTWLERVNLASESVDASVSVGSNPVDVAISSEALWVLNHEGTITHVALD